jgi:hypothetical protein
VSIPATQMRPGMVIKHNYDLHREMASSMEARKGRLPERQPARDGCLPAASVVIKVVVRLFGTGHPALGKIDDP